MHPPAFGEHEMTDDTDTVIRRRGPSDAATLTADICVLGAGITGVSAAVEAARLGRRVVIADAAPALGGQAIGSIVGTIIGLFSHGRAAYQITHGLADELIEELTASPAPAAQPAYRHRDLSIRAHAARAVDGA